MIEAMPYTQSLLSNGMAVGYHAKAAPPTVTMPRLKAMVSGAIGGFLDVAFNFNTQALLDDNILGQFYDIGWRMVMHGDETWLKLFPGLFTRYDGVSSFYVKDTIEVDHNVSRHLEVELSTDDWNLLILHYLGLDHVGHTGGRSSNLMIPKLMEMDEIIKMIHMSKILPEDDPHRQTLLLVVSDHGMTENGNHGGSSYEETDSLALFIGLRSKILTYASATQNAASQVDMASTLALLFGVPIPKNNVGVLMPEVFGSLTDDQWIRALELNSWQLLRLLQAQLPGLSQQSFPCNDSSYEQSSKFTECIGQLEQKFCHFYSKATVFHSSWKSRKGQTIGSINIDDLRNAVKAYDEFLRIASDWLSRRATDKPLDLLTSGVATMFVSSMILLRLLFLLCKQAFFAEKQFLPNGNKCSYKWDLDELFVLSAILIVALSMTSSSIVEEEQYIWHFMASTLYLIFLRRTFQSVPAGPAPFLLNVFNGQNCRKYSQVSSVILVLICGRILRGWHQGGVNWTHLPDISKWLEQAGPHSIKSIQIASILAIISLWSFLLYSIRSKRGFILTVQTMFLISGLLVLLHTLEYQDHTFAVFGYTTTSIAQMVYVSLGVTVIMTAVASPWVMYYSNSETRSNGKAHLVTFSSIDNGIGSCLFELRYSSYLTGWAYTASWCLLQGLLQQPINTVPILLIFLQILSSLVYFSTGGIRHKLWVEVAALYFLGMAGHFGLGNSNTLATIDVAGAYIGLSSHSTLFAGILMFTITFASPLLLLLSMVMYISIKDMRYLSVSQVADMGHLLLNTIAFPSLVPLSLNSILLTTFTVVLLLMRNHLFVWSVFSPKYLYVCATTASVYAGVTAVAATGIYICLVVALSIRNSNGNIRSPR
ncbi:GPI ethanolamine phosphate transferase 2 isoform X2 [Macadamia integrifolia]|nr:GPI ethanolamine phosphate transferase 2 isoform X2 [Macadamia integrifolia]XP_042507867.1 GPI ethanolamine phosphate transferase 2 isoform X2 [Macadamia integrifolia]XP_042507868.1 GPI ethanolamine phosphate transferase 2 isoform X2 [Macadamia integrifolia]